MPLDVRAPAASTCAACAIIAALLKDTSGPPPPAALQAGAYLSLARGTAFDEAHTRWCRLVLDALPTRTGQR
jgi:hypothetical protein